jgi:hypothetical protein
VVYDPPKSAVDESPSRRFSSPHMISTNTLGMTGLDCGRSPQTKSDYWGGCRRSFSWLTQEVAYPIFEAAPLLSLPTAYGQCPFRGPPGAVAWFAGVVVPGAQVYDLICRERRARLTTAKFDGEGRRGRARSRRAGTRCRILMLIDAAKTPRACLADRRTPESRAAVRGAHARALLGRRHPVPCAR